MMIPRIALSYLLHRRRQTIISIFGVMLGVTFFIGISSMMKGFHSYFIDKLIDASPHVIIKDEFRNPGVQPARAFHPDAVVEIRGIKPKEELRGIRNAERMLPYIQSLSGVSVSPTLHSQVFLRYGGQDVSSSLIGILPELEIRSSKLEQDMVQGSLRDLLTNTSGLIAGSELARKMSLRVGSKVLVISPAGIVKKMKIVGIFSTGLTEVDATTSYAMLKKVQIIQDREDVINQINLRLADVYSAPKVSEMLENRYGYRTEAWQETFANIFQLFVVQNAIMTATVGAIALVAGFGIFNIISTTVSEKTRDIAILKSIGFSERDIQLIFLMLGVIVGCFGSLLGIGFGRVFIETMARVDLKMDKGSLVSFDGFPMFHSVWLYVIGSVAAILVSGFSAYLPARKAAALNPVAIIRGAS